MMQLLLQIAGAVLAGGLVSAVGSYIGIKVGLARLQAQFTTWVDSHHEAHQQVNFRLQRLESAYFRRSKANGETHYARDRVE
jgi:hypothetical protein